MPGVLIRALFPSTTIGGPDRVPTHSTTTGTVYTLPMEYPSPTSTFHSLTTSINGTATTEMLYSSPISSITGTFTATPTPNNSSIPIHVIIGATCGSVGLLFATVLILVWHKRRSPATLPSPSTNNQTHELPTQPMTQHIELPLSRPNSRHELSWTQRVVVLARSTGCFFLLLFFFCVSTPD